VLLLLHELQLVRRGGSHGIENHQTQDYQTDHNRYVAAEKAFPPSMVFLVVRIVPVAIVRVSDGPTNLVRKWIVDVSALMSCHVF